MAHTYNELYIETRRRLRDAGISAYALEARLITAMAAGKTTEKLLQDLNYYTTDAIARSVRELCDRRLAGEPVAYITGRWEFYGLPLEITPSVLIPRADTEVLVEKSVEMLRGVRQNAHVLDLCTGSGCVGCAIAKTMPAARVTLVDNSRAALDVARRNIRLNSLSSRVVCVEADVTQPPPLRLGRFDLITCNPPYIRTDELPTLDAEVRDYEPISALDGGEDGLDFYRAVLSRWTVLLSRGGAMLFEVGEGQADDVLNMMRGAGFIDLGTVRDTGATERVVFGVAP
ncbi:MAG: peptide chain release factor N(5)-glutamine methyltransferase [Oscillospiraceae bacterium]|nr:peptide chain release factor N(5)-glutamine methyltransferase [Oscillospiraceae bacterium]